MYIERCYLSQIPHSHSSLLFTLNSAILCVTSLFSFILVFLLHRRAGTYVFSSTAFLIKGWQTADMLTCCFSHLTIYPGNDDVSAQSSPTHFIQLWTVPCDVPVHYLGHFQLSCHYSQCCIEQPCAHGLSHCCKVSSGIFL